METTPLCYIVLLKHYQPDRLDTTLHVMTEPDQIERLRGVIQTHKAKYQGGMVFTTPRRAPESGANQQAEGDETD